MFKITKEHESNLSIAVSAASTKSHVQAFENVLIQAEDGKLSLKAGDSLIEITSVFECEVEQSGACMVNAVKFLQAVKSCGFNCDVLFLNDSVQIKSGRKKYTLSSLPPENYPSYPNHTDANKIDVDFNLIGEMKLIGKVAPTDDVRHYLNGVYIGKYIAATNGHRLCIKDGVDFDGEILVPIQSVRKMPMLTNCEYFASSDILIIKSDELTVKTKLLDGRFPDVKRVIPKADMSAIFDKSDLADAVRDCLITSNENNTVSLDITKSDCTVKSKASKKDESTMVVQCKSENETSVAFKSNYLIDALSFYSDDVKIGFAGNAMVIDGDVINVVMGVKI